MCTNLGFFQKYTSKLVSPYLYQHWVLFIFFAFSTLLGEKCYLILLLICISWVYYS